jgi:hypothetical protein
MHIVRRALRGSQHLHSLSQFLPSIWGGEKALKHGVLPAIFKAVLDSFFHGAKSQKRNVGWHLVDSWIHEKKEKECMM